MKIKITNFLVSKEILDLREVPLFHHSLDVIRHHFLIIISIIFLGMTINRLFEAITFICIYPFLRKYSGGVHAISRKRCYMLTIFSFTSLLILNSTVHPIILLCLSVLAGSFIIRKSPLEQPENPLNLRQMEHYHNNSTRMVMFLLIYSIIGLFAHPSCIYTTILLSVIFAAIDMALAYEVKNQHRRIYYPVLCKIALFVLAIGKFNLQATCDGWKYQPLITSNLRKYMDE